MKVVNPYTGRMVNKNGVTYKKIRKNVVRDYLMMEYSNAKRIKNIFTKRNVLKSGATYLRVKKALERDYNADAFIISDKSDRLINKYGHTYRKLLREMNKEEMEEVKLSSKVFIQNNYAVKCILYKKEEERIKGFKYITRNGVLYRQSAVMNISVHDDDILNFNKASVHVQDEQFKNLVKILSEDDNFAESWKVKNMSSPVLLIIVQAVKKMHKDGTFEPVQEQNFGDVKKICNHYINYDVNINATTFGDLFVERFNTEYVMKNQKPESCFVNCIVDTFHDAFEKKKEDGKRRYKELTYDSLCDILDITERDQNIGLSVKESEPFFEKYKLGLDVLSPVSKMLYSYRPDKLNNKISPNVLRILVYNRHIYKMNDNVKEFDQIKENMMDDITNIKVSEHYHIRKKNDEENSYSIASLDDVVKTIQETDKKVIRCIYGGDAIDLLMQMYTVHNYTPNVIMSRFSKIQSINFKVGEIVCHIIPVDNTDEAEDDLCIPTKYAVNYMNAEYDFYSKVVRKEFISEYHPSVRSINNELPKRALTGYFGYAEHTNAIDMVKAYSSRMCEITKIPVFGYFDVYFPYDGHDIEEYTMYIVKSERTDDVADIMLLPEQYHRCYGFLLKHCRDFEIVFYNRPSKIIDVNFKQAVEDCYKADLGDINLNKMIVNRTTGLYEKKYNHNVYTRIFKNEEEAAYYARIYGGKIYPMWKGDEVECYILQIDRKQELVDGLRYIKEMIYDMQTLKVVEMYKKLVENNIYPVAVKTDALFIEEDYEKVKDIFDFSGKFGGVKFEKDKKFGLDTELRRRCNEKPYVARADDVVKIKINDEYKQDEFNNVFNSCNRVIVQGMAGSGKTTSIKNYEGKKLFIAPFNKHCQEMRKEGYNCITLNHLFGIAVYEGQQCKKYDVSAYDVICFDEAYLCSPINLKLIDEFIRSNSDKKVFATGDIKQLKPFGYGYNNIQGDEQYRKHCISMVFSYQITLQEIKRLKTIEDKKRMIGLFHDIFNTKKDIIDTFKKYNIKMIHHMNDLKTTKNICYFNFRVHQVNRYVKDHIIHKKEDYWKGMVLTCNKHFKNKKSRLFVNCDYVLDRIDDKTVTVRNELDEEIIIPRKILKNFKLPYASTIHSTQGDTIDEPITIFDSNIAHVDRNMIWTALTRCTSLDNVTIFVHDEDEVEKMKASKLKQYLKLKINGYKHQDTIAARVFDDRNYIDCDSVHHMLDACDWKCLRCGVPLEMHVFDGEVRSNITVQCNDNGKGHVKGNCSVLCCLCNCSLK